MTVAGGLIATGLLAPKTLLRAGSTASEFETGAAASSFGETGITFRATDRPFTNVSWETAVTPPLTFRFA